MYYHHCLIAIIGAAAVNKTKESTTCSPLIVTNQVMTLLALHNVCVSTWQWKTNLSKVCVLWLCMWCACISTMMLVLLFSSSNVYHCNVCAYVRMCCCCGVFWGGQRWSRHVLREKLKHAHWKYTYWAIRNQTCITILPIMENGYNEKLICALCCITYHLLFSFHHQQLLCKRRASWCWFMTGIPCSVAWLSYAATQLHT